jgi:hypothetical protein
MEGYAVQVNYPFFYFLLTVALCSIALYALWEFIRWIA